MQLEDVFLARFAELTPDGLFTVVGGGINRITAGSFPWSWGLFVMLLRIRLTAEEGKAPHLTAIDRESPNGQTELILANSPMAPLPESAATGPGGKFGLSFTYWLTNQVFSEAGVYKYRFKIDGNLIGVAELFVAPPGQGEPIR